VQSKQSMRFVSRIHISLPAKWTINYQYLSTQVSHGALERRFIEITIIVTEVTLETNVSICYLSHCVG